MYGIFFQISIHKRFKKINHIYRNIFNLYEALLVNLTLSN